MSRLRLLRLLEREELSVGELAAIMQMPQSTVSRHLKVLLEGGWVSRRSEGTTGRYWLDTGLLPEEARRLWELVQEQMGDSPQIRQDLHRLRNVLTQREIDSLEYFGQVGGEWDSIRRELFGERFTEEALLSLIPSNWVIADVGCGTGEITSIIAPRVREVHAIDVSEAMLKAARKRLREFRNVRFHQADLGDLPLDDESVDAICVSLVLHHVPAPESVFDEFARVVRKRTGRVLVIDMAAHEREEYRRQMGHQHLGFDPAVMGEWMRRAGLDEISVQYITSQSEARGPDLFVIAGTRSAK